MLPSLVKLPSVHHPKVVAVFDNIIQLVPPCIRSAISGKGLNPSYYGRHMSEGVGAGPATSKWYDGGALSR